MPLRRALYAGSFDPPTAGHLWLALTGLSLFDELIVAIGQNPDKRGFLPANERAALFEQSLLTAGADRARFSVREFSRRFTVDVARETGAAFLLRGVRGSDDLEHERTQRRVNGDLAPELTTVFLMPPRELCEVSSTFVRGLVGLDGWREAVSRMVPAAVLEALDRKATAEPG